MLRGVSLERGLCAVAHSNPMHARTFGNRSSRKLTSQLFRKDTWEFRQGFEHYRPMRKLEHLPEVAIAGRSNCGKSSLINALTAAPGLARTSRTPGRTQMLNVFEARLKRGPSLRLVDLPGYGYTAAGVDAGLSWSKMIRNYLMDGSRGGAGLELVLVLVDARRGLGEMDLAMTRFLETRGLKYQAV